MNLKELLNEGLSPLGEKYKARFLNPREWYKGAEKNEAAILLQLFNKITKLTASRKLTEYDNAVLEDLYMQRVASLRNRN